MSRSAKKGPFVEERLMSRVEAMNAANEKRMIRTWSRAAARDIEKVLHSAVSNAESRDDLRWNGEDLVVVAAYANEGPTLKRWRARAPGRVNRIRKRTCHITIQLAVAEPGEIKRPA